MDPDAADFVLKSGVPVVLLPMDVTHQLVFTKKRRELALRRWGRPLGEKLVQMLAAAENLDRANFGLSGAVVHDTHVFLYLLAPHLYRSAKIGIGVVTDRRADCHGSVERTSCDPIEIVTDLLDPDGAFELLLESVAGVLEPMGK
jgi:purine nucleosidase